MSSKDVLLSNDPDIKRGRLRDDKRGSAAWLVGVLLLVAVLLAMLYVASFGPVGAYIDSLETRETHLVWFRIAYHPLYWLGSHSPRFESWLVWHYKFWRPVFSD